MNISKVIFDCINIFAIQLIVMLEHNVKLWDKRASESILSDFVQKLLHLLFKNPLQPWINIGKYVGGLNYHACEIRLEVATVNEGRRELYGLRHSASRFSERAKHFVFKFDS